jgi:hypothetical protein
MSLRYGKVSQKPTFFRRLFGLTPAHSGRNLKLDLKIILLILLAYDRSYIPREFVGFLFGIESSRGCRLMRRMERSLAKIMPIEKTRALSQKEVKELLIDATEQPTWRPKRKETSIIPAKKASHDQNRNPNKRARSHSPRLEMAPRIGA